MWKFSPVHIDAQIRKFVQPLASEAYTCYSNSRITALTIQCPVDHNHFRGKASTYGYFSSKHESH
jgi:hypothetical protein